MRKLLSIVLLLALLIGGVEAKHFLRDEPAKAGVSKVMPHGFTLSADASTDHLLWYSSLVRPFFPELESHFESERKADYIEQLTGSLASPRGPPVLVAGPPIGQRISAPRPVAAPSGTTYFLDETGLSGAAAAWSVARKLDADYAGSAFRVRRSSDSTEQDIGFSGENIDTASLTSFCSGTDGFVVTVYDQSGGANNLTQATASLQPKIVTSGTIITGANGKPCVRFDGSDDKLADLLTLNQPTTGFHVFAQQAWTSGDGIFGGGGGITQSLLQTSSSPIFAMFAGSAGANITGFSIGTWNLGTFIFNGSSSTWSRNNGTDTTVNPNTGNSSGFTWGSRSQTDASCAQVDFQETVLYSAVKNNTDRTTAQNNINAFYSLW